MGIVLRKAEILILPSCAFPQVRALWGLKESISLHPKFLSGFLVPVLLCYGAVLWGKQSNSADVSP